MLASLLDERRPPTLPDEFAFALESKQFTNGSDRDAVAALQSKVCQAVLAGVEDLDFTQLPWGPEELASLAKALTHMPLARSLDLDPLKHGMSADGIHAFFSHGALPLKELLLGNNSLGDSGTVALAEAFAAGKMPFIELLRIGDSNIGDVGGLAIAKAIGGGHVPKLHNLRMQKNRLTSRSVVPLAQGIKEAKLKLTCLMLYSNEMDDDGLLALADALVATGSIETLNTLYVMPNPIQKPGYTAITNAIGTRQIKNDLNEFEG